MKIEPFQLAAEITLTYIHLWVSPCSLFSKPAMHMVLFFNFVMQASWWSLTRNETWLKIGLQVKKDKICLQVKKDKI
jgi:hypothetical protein